MAFLERSLINKCLFGKIGYEPKFKKTARAFAFGKSLARGIGKAIVIGIAAFEMMTPLNSLAIDFGRIYTSDFYFNRVYMTWDSSYDVTFSIIRDWRGEKHSEHGAEILTGGVWTYTASTGRTIKSQPQWYPQGWAGYKSNIRDNTFGGSFSCEQSEQTFAVDYDHTVESSQFDFPNPNPDLQTYHLFIEMDVIPRNGSAIRTQITSKTVRFGDSGRVKLSIPDDHSRVRVRYFAQTRAQYLRNIAKMFWEKLSSLWA